MFPVPDTNLYEDLFQEKCYAYLMDKRKSIDIGENKI
jgi:hypothetical protein